MNKTQAAKRRRAQAQAGEIACSQKGSRDHSHQSVQRAVILAFPQDEN